MTNDPKDGAPTNAELDRRMSRLRARRLAIEQDAAEGHPAGELVPQGAEDLYLEKLRLELRIAAMESYAERGVRQVEAHREMTRKAADARRGQRKVSDDAYREIRAHYRSLIEQGEERTNATRRIARTMWEGNDGRPCRIDARTARRYTEDLR